MHRPLHSILLQNATLVAPGSPLNGQALDVLIVNGQIAQIGKDLAVSNDIFIKNCTGRYLSAGWCDMRALLPEPGYEHRETLQSGCNAAAAGGFTHVAVLPNTQPLLQSKEPVAFVQAASQRYAAHLHPIAAASADLGGEDLTEMCDLHQAGAVAFSDGLQPIYKTSLLFKALQYLQHFDGLLIDTPDEKSLTQYGQMHEGVASTLLGMAGMPPLAEHLSIARTLQVLAHTGGKVHFSCISSAQSVQMLREAKQRGMAVSADVASYHLAFTDDDLADFDTNLKVKPPLRTAADREALRAGLADGTIDAIVSNHIPHDEEGKKLEFDLAEFGMINLQTSFALANTYGGLSLENLIEKICIAPRRILKLPLPQWAVGQAACFTLFDPQAEWTLQASEILSKSHNTPLVGKTLKGKPLAVINGTMTFGI